MNLYEIEFYDAINKRLIKKRVEAMNPVAALIIVRKDCDLTPRKIEKLETVPGTQENDSIHSWLNGHKN